MFSVNIDKLVTMTDAQLAAYKKLAAGLADEFNKKSLAVVGNPLVAFKLAATVMECDKKVIFVDGDFSKSVFLGKYKLGKDLSGACEYIAGEKQPQELICKTNHEKLQIVFTGNVESRNDVEVNVASFKTLVEAYKAECDIVVVVAGGADVAGICDATVVVADGADYSQEAVNGLVDDLMGKGCNCAGVILENC
ncbi:MAG: hypothetical protein ACI4EV_09075 [Lachnospiraceae bacterium]